MATKFRQPIRAGQSGSDVTAIKRAMKKMRAVGWRKLNADSNVAGPAFVELLDTILRNHHKKSDHIYGPEAHEIIAPYFDKWGVVLYSTAKIRKPDPTFPVPHATAREMAKRLLVLRGEGRYQAVNPGDLSDIERTAQGLPVWSRRGYWVNIDHRPLELLVFLIDGKNFTIGTYALCSDHHDDGPHGHAGGLAVDVEHINGHGIGNGGMHDLTLEVARIIMNAPGELRPRQLICDGSGNLFSSDIAACCLPSRFYYDYWTLAGHRNHIHAGY